MLELGADEPEAVDRPVNEEPDVSWLEVAVIELDVLD